VRVSLTTVLGYLFALPLPRALGIDPGWGAAGLTASAGLAGWIEMLLLRRAMRARIGSTGMPGTFLVTLWIAAIAGAALGWLVKLTLPPVHPIVEAAAVLAPYGVTYFGVTLALGLPEATGTVRRVLRRR
jgi:putative peptidoglycan lipid II flippase